MSRDAAGPLPLHLDRQSPTPLQEQIVLQVRYLVATGALAVGAPLPSTRALARQFGLSFHTVRKAYQALEQEGLLEGLPGGYRVRRRITLSKSARMEQASAVLQDALTHLLGLGLSGEDIGYALEEQLESLSRQAVVRKTVFAAAYLELAEDAAAQLAQALQQPVEAVETEALGRHRDADTVIARFAELASAAASLPHSDALGVVTHLNAEALDLATRVSPHQTLGVVVRDVRSLAPLLDELRLMTGFAGQVLAAAVEDAPRHLTGLLAQSDFLLYTRACKRRLAPLVADFSRQAVLRHDVTPDSIALVRSLLPSG